MAIEHKPADRAPSAPRPRPPGRKPHAWFKDFAKAQRRLDAPVKLMARIDRLLAEVERPQDEGGMTH